MKLLRIKCTVIFILCQLVMQLRSCSHLPPVVWPQQRLTQQCLRPHRYSLQNPVPEPHGSAVIHDGHSAPQMELFPDPDPLKTDCAIIKENIHCCSYNPLQVMQYPRTFLKPRKLITVSKAWRNIMICCMLFIFYTFDLKFGLCDTVLSFCTLLLFSSTKIIHCIQKVFRHPSRFSMLLYCRQKLQLFKIFFFSIYLIMTTLYFVPHNDKVKTEV